MDNEIEKLNKFFKIVQNAIVTPEELQAFLIIMMNFVKSAKDNFQELSDENLLTIKEAIPSIEQRIKEVTSALNDKLSKDEEYINSVSNDVLGVFSSQIKASTDQSIQQVQTSIDKPIKDILEEIKSVKEFLKEVKAIKIQKPKDGIDGINGTNGKDGSPDTGKEIVEKVNALPTDDEDLKIDAVHIKNLPKTIEKISGGVSPRNLYQLNDVNVEGVTNGQVLTYNSTTNLWGAGTGGGGATSPLTTKGDIWVYSTTDTRLPIGTDGYVLTADSTQASGLKWNAVSGTGTVTQVNTAGLISGGPINTTGTITTSMATNKLVGRGTAGTGIMEEITLGTGLALTGTTLNVSGFVTGSGTVGKVPLWTTSSSNLADSVITQAGSFISIANTHDLVVGTGVIQLASGVQLINSSGNLSLGGGYVLETAGGTGQTGYAVGDTLYANTTTTLAKRTIGSTGDVYTVSGGVPVWAPPAAPASFALTKTDDTNVTLTLGGSPSNALLAATSLTLGWTGTLADGRIASASTWNAKQAALSGTGIVKSTAGVISYLTDNSTNWDTAYTNRITSLTTTGTSGAATLISNTLNIPQYQAAGTYVTSVGATSPITSSGGTTPTISTSMSTGKLIGRGTAGTGVFEEITLGTNLSLSGTTLNATGGGSSGPTLGQIHAYVMGVM